MSSSVNGESMKRLMDIVITSNFELKTIDMILDNASYYYSKDIEECRQNLGKITFIFYQLIHPI
jgi:hypothetical protein